MASESRSVEFVCPVCRERKWLYPSWAKARKVCGMACRRKLGAIKREQLRVTRVMFVKGCSEEYARGYVEGWKERGHRETQARRFRSRRRQVVEAVGSEQWEKSA